MKRCVNCCALISDDYNKKCPYCIQDPDVVVDEFEHIYNIDNAGEYIDDRWPKENSSILVKGIELCVIHGGSPNKIRKSLGLEELKGE